LDSPLELRPLDISPSLDRLKRPLRELRLSVIDRCNFRCTYCMPLGSMKGKGSFLPLEKLLTDHEIVNLVEAFAGLGVHKLRITGGEPLIRPGLPALIEQLAVIQGLDDIALTTNGVLLDRLAVDLANAGLGRLTVSLDTLDPEILDAMSGGKARLHEVLAGIAAAEQAGFERIKINTVVQKGVNDHTVLDLLDHFRGSGHPVRLIEFMDVGNSNHWNPGDVVPNAAWIERIHQRWPIEPVVSSNPAETARRYRYRDGAGEIGFISSISQPFCGGCARARVTADGILYTCLFSNRGTHLMPLIRHSDGPDRVQQMIHDVWLARTDRYSEERDEVRHEESKVEMYRMGG